GIWLHPFPCRHCSHSRASHNESFLRSLPPKPKPGTVARRTRWRPDNDCGSRGSAREVRQPSRYARILLYCSFRAYLAHHLGHYHRFSYVVKGMRTQHRRCALRAIKPVTRLLRTSCVAKTTTFGDTSVFLWPVDLRNGARRSAESDARFDGTSWRASGAGDWRPLLRRYRSVDSTR